MVHDNVFKLTLGLSVVENSDLLGDFLNDSFGFVLELEHFSQPIFKVVTEGSIHTNLYRYLQIDPIIIHINLTNSTSNLHHYTI